MKSITSNIKLFVYKNNLYENISVYSFGLSIPESILLGHKSPYTLVFQLKAGISGGYVEKTITLVTKFNKKNMDTSLLHELQDIKILPEPLTLYEGTKVSIKKRYFDSFDMSVSCVDTEGEHIFFEKEFFSKIEEQWMSGNNYEGISFYWSNQHIYNEYHQYEQQLLNSYYSASEIFGHPYKTPVRVYIVDKMCYVYDLVTYFPVDNACSAAYFRDTIVILVDGRETYGTALSPHEFVHLLINSYANEMNVAEKIMSEGVCEYISNDFYCRKGWISLESRAALGALIIKSLGYNGIEDWLQISHSKLDSIPIDYYLLLPLLVDFFIKLNGYTSIDLLKLFSKQDTLFKLFDVAKTGVGTIIQFAESIIERALKSKEVDTLYSSYMNLYLCISTEGKVLTESQYNTLKNKLIISHQKLLTEDLK